MPGKGKKATGGKRSKQTSPKGTQRSKRSKHASPIPDQKSWYNVNALACLVLLLVNTRRNLVKGFNSFFQQNRYLTNDKRENESDSQFETRIHEQTTEWVEMTYDDAKHTVISNIDELAENDKFIKTLISDTAMNMDISEKTEQELHANIVTTIFGKSNSDDQQVLNDRQEPIPKSVEFLKSPPKTNTRPAPKRKLSQSEPRKIRGTESEQSPKRTKVKIVQDGEDPMVEVIIPDDSPSITTPDSTNVSSNGSSKSKKMVSECNGSSPRCTLSQSPITLKSVTPPHIVQPLDFNSNLNTPSPNHCSFDSSLEGLIQVTESNKKIFEQKRANLEKPKTIKKASGIKITNPDSPSHPANKKGAVDSDDDSPKNKILSSSAWPRDPLIATSAKLAWEMGGLLSGSQAPGSSSSTPLNVPMETTNGTSKRKSDAISPTPITAQSKKSRNTSPPKSKQPTPKPNIQSKTRSPPKNSNGVQNDRKIHAIPAFFFPRNVKNHGEFCSELAEKNPEIRNGFDVGTFKNGQKYIKPRTLQIANKFKSPLTAFGMLYDFIQVNSDQKSGHTVKAIKVPYSRNTCKHFDSNTNINWIRVVDIRSDQNGMRTCTLIMNFKNLAPPKVYIGQMVFSTHPHNPEPKRCTKCQHFGHYKGQCKRETICTFCSGPHESSVCYQKKQNDETIKLKCSNCQGPHAASSKKCPVYIASVQSLQNEPSAQPSVSIPTPAPEREPVTVSNANGIPSLLDLEFFPPLPTRRHDSHLHIPFDNSFRHTYSGKMATTLHLLRQMQMEHPTAKLAIENLAFSIGGESFRDTVKK